MDSIVNIVNVANWFDSINYKDDGDHYTLKMIHSLGINNSIINKALFENLFEEYGVKIEADISEIGLYVKVYKPLCRLSR